MKLIKYTILLFFIASSNAFSQGAGNRMLFDVIDPSQQNLTLMYGEGKEGDYAGSPLLIDEWVKGAIKTNNGTDFNDIELKYETFRHYLFVKKEEESIALTNGLIDEFAFSYAGESYLFKNMELPVFNGKKGFARVIYEGDDLAIYQVFFKKLVKATTVDNGYSSVKRTKDKFVSVEKLFVKMDENVEEIGKSKKDFYNLMPQKAKEIKTFMKSNNIDTKKKRDLAELGGFIDKLTD